MQLHYYLIAFCISLLCSTTVLSYSTPPTRGLLTRSTDKQPFLPQPHADGSYCPTIAVSVHVQELLYAAYVDAFYYEKNLTYAFSAFISPSLIQHNPFIGQGSAAALAATAPLAEAELTVLHVAFQANIGWIHYKVEAPGRPPTAAVDLLRYEGSCAVEHWDVIEALPANATNPLALF